MRAVPIWSGKTDDSAIPPRVMVRVLTLADGCCALCTRKVGPGEFDLDHIVALANGGSHSEDNLQVACKACHKGKTRADRTEKKVIDRKRKKHLGISPRRGRPIPGSKASGWVHRMNGKWERRT